MAKAQKKNVVVRRGKKNSAGLAKKLRKACLRFIQISFVLGVVASSVYGGLKIYKAVLTSPSLEIKSITVAGNQRVIAADLLEVSGLEEGQNLIAVDTAEAIRRIEAHPWVKKASITRTLPDKVTIDIREEKALLLVSLEALYVVNVEGKIFKRYSPGDGLDLTVITGLEEYYIEDPSYRLQSGVLELIEFLASREGIGLKDISEVNVDSRHGYTLYTLNEGIKLEIGEGNLESKFKAFERVVGIRGGLLKGIVSVDLNNGRGVVVKLVRAEYKKGGMKANVKKG